MNVLIPITVDVAAVGAAAVVIPATGAAVAAGDAMASVGMTAIRGGVVGGVALATLMNCMGGDVSLGSNGQVVTPAVAANVGDVGFNGHQWYYLFGNVVGDEAVYGASPDAACAAALSAGGLFKYAGIGTGSNIGALYRMTTNRSNLPICYAAYLYSTDRYVTGYAVSGSSCVADPVAPKVPAMNTQIQNTVKVRPDPWPFIYSDMNYGPTLALASGSTSGPCYRLYNDPCVGFGASFSTGGSSWSNDDYVVNSASCPSATVITAPTTDTQTKMNADGSKTTTSTTTIRTMTVTSTNDRTDPVVGQTTTTTTTATTVINADGSITIITETTTNRAPPQTGTNTNQQQRDQTRPMTATLVSPDIKLCDKKTKALGGVLNASYNVIRASAAGAGVQGFFTVSASGNCPQWAVPQTDWTSSIVLGPIFYSSLASLAYQIAGYAVLAAAVLAAFATAFL